MVTKVAGVVGKTIKKTAEHPDIGPVMVKVVSTTAAGIIGGGAYMANDHYKSEREIQAKVELQANEHAFQTALKEKELEAIERSALLQTARETSAAWNITKSHKDEKHGKVLEERSEILHRALQQRYPKEELKTDIIEQKPNALEKVVSVKTQSVLDSDLPAVGGWWWPWGGL